MAVVSVVLPRYFNPRSPCGERPDGSFFIRALAAFQSTLPVWGATRRQHKKRCWKPTFQSTLPVWGATKKMSEGLGGVVISIHAPRVGSDDDSGFQFLFPGLISIHAPRVGSDGQDVNALADAVMHFNPRSPCGERLDDYGRFPLGRHISIHAPRVGSDVNCGEGYARGIISIHAPRVGSD